MGGGYRGGEHRVITIADENGSLCPIIICDVCGDRITVLDRGNFEFDYDFDKQVIISNRFVHKRCTCIDWQQRPLFWIPLRDFLGDLSYNCLGLGAIGIVGNVLFSHNQHEFYCSDEIPVGLAGVYLIYDGKNCIAYIGQSKDVKNRLGRNNHPTADIAVQKIVVLPIEHIEERLSLEGMLVNTVRPYLNKKKRIRLVV